MVSRLTVTVLACSVSSLWAESIFITGFKGTTGNSSDFTPAPASVVDSGFAGTGASNGSASQVNPTPIIPNNARRVHYARTPGATWLLTPTDMEVTPVTPAGTGPYTFSQLKNTGVYKIYLTKGQSLNASTNIIVEMSATENELPAQLADSNGVAAATIQLDMFQRSKPNHIWVHVGYITNTTFNPTIKLQHVSGDIDDNAHATLDTGQRWYTDAIWFELIDACVGVASQVGIDGPLVQGQTFVNVTGVAAGATNVTIYVNNVEVAQTNSTGPGFTAGNLTVIVPALNKGDKITAGQTKNGCTSLVPTSGPTVGSGNAQVRAFLSCLQNSAFTGPIGTPGTNGFTANYFLKGTGFAAAFGTAPTGGEPLPPGTCWQTVTFTSSDPALLSGGGNLSITDPFCALGGLVFSIDDTSETGPYEIYIDQIKNGDTVIEDFEGYTNGDVKTFTVPSAAGNPAPGSTYLPSPNSSVVSQNNAFDGTNSCRIQWQWTDSSNIRWAHILATNTTGKVYPQLDTAKPVTVRYLLLPVGETTNKLHFSSMPTNQIKVPGESATFSITAVGEAPITYQWYQGGNEITGETNSTYTRSNVQPGDTGEFTVVTTGSGCSITNSATLTVFETVPPPTLEYTVSGSQITFTWAGSFMLQSRSAVDSGNWTDITPSSGYVEDLTASTTKYFRLRQN